jgi:hypothetical protein
MDLTAHIVPRGIRGESVEEDLLSRKETLTIQRTENGYNRQML